MNGRILVVDDSSLARRTLRQILEGAGFEVEDAPDGATALERYFLKPHDLIMLDMVMESMYGLDVLSKFRELNPQVRVIVATADIQSSTREQVKAAGAAGMLNKPFNRETVLAAVETVVNGGQLWN